jgi:superfamily II DNA or RNA helicase
MVVLVVFSPLTLNILSVICRQIKRWTRSPVRPPAYHPVVPLDVTPIAHLGIREAPNWQALADLAQAEKLSHALTSPWSEPWYDAELPNSWSDLRGQVIRGLGLKRVVDVLTADGLEQVLVSRCGQSAMAQLDHALRVFLSRSVAKQRRVTKQLHGMRAVLEEERLRGTPDPLSAPVPREDLEAWATHFQVRDLLDQMVGERINPFGAVEEIWLDRHGDNVTVAEALMRPPFRGANPRTKSRGVPWGIQEQLALDLRGEAGARRVAADEASRPLLAPLEGPRARAFEQLLEARAWLSQASSEPARESWEDAVVWWRSDPPSFSVSLLNVRRHPGSMTVLPRAIPSETVRCGCEPDLRRTCPDALRAVYVALAMLADPPHPEARRAFEEDLGRPAWQSTFDAFDEALSAHGIQNVAEPTPSEPLGWRLNDSKTPWQLLPVRCAPKRAGGWTSSLADDAAFRSGAARLELPADREIASLVCPWFVVDALRRPGKVSASDMLRALPLLIDHPRVFLGGRGGKQITVRRAALTLGVERRGDGGLDFDPRLGGRSLRAHELRRLAEHDVDGAPAPLLDKEAAACVLVDLSHAASALLQILQDRGLSYDADAATPLMERLPRIEQAIPVELATSLRGERLPSEGILRVRLEPSGGLAIAARVRPLPGGLVLVPGEGPDVLYGEVDGRPVHVFRDLDDEAMRTRELAGSLGLAAAHRSGPGAWFVEEDEVVAGVIDGLRGRTDIVAEWTGKRRLRVTRVDALSDLKIQIREIDGWFSLDGRFEVDGDSLSLSEVLLALEQGRRFIRLDGDGWLALDETVRDQLTEATGGVIPRRGEQMLSPLHAPQVERLVNHGVQINAPQSWRLLTERVEASARYTPSIPRGLDAELRTYQAAGFRWAARLAGWAPGGVLADDMGLGKTIQALALLLNRRGNGPSLVVAPTSVGFNWMREIKRFAPGFRAVLHRGPGRSKDLSDRGRDDVVVMSWDVLVRDIEHLASLEWGTVVFDEAQAIKTSTTRRAKASRRIEAGFRLALTGTPVENHAGELWSLFHTVCPGLLGSAQQFRQRYGGLIAKGSLAARAALSAAIRPFLLRRLKSEVALELPSRTEIEVRVTLPEDARRTYEAARRAALGRLEAARKNPEVAKKLRFQALADLTRLRRLACHPALIDPESTARSAKLERLRELVLQLRAEGHAALVFSQFVGLLKLVRPVLEADGAIIRWIDGSVPAKGREDEVDRFQRGDGDVFLISLKAGGTGLNLTSATYVIHLDPWWNPAAEDQATDRAHRIGQEQPVTVYRLVAEDTVEDGVLELQEAKRELVTGLLEGTGRAAPFDMDELAELMTRTARGYGD